MTTTRTRYELTDGIATITMDDGKVNALSPDMTAELAGACAAGFLDEVVAAEALPSAALAAAQQLAAVDPAAHAATKLRVRREVLAGLEDGIARLEGDGREW